MIILENLAHLSSHDGRVDSLAREGVDVAGRVSHDDQVIVVSRLQALWKRKRRKKKEKIAKNP